MNALELALANAAANTPKGEELHLENLDSIADPTLDQPVIDYHQRMQQEYDAKRASQRFYVEEQPPQKEADYNVSTTPTSTRLFDSIDYKLGEITNAVMYTHKEAELTKLRLDALADMITEVSTTISKAAQSMPQEPDLKHRSLHEWDDTYLINELVERENALMPFYYELLKRIGSPDLHNLVMSSMQGKNSSMIVLAQLCAALGNAATQPQPPQAHEVRLSQSAEQRMDEAFHSATTPQTYTQAQLDNLRFNGQSPGITVEEIEQYERMKQSTVIPQGISRWDNSFPQR